MKKYLSIAVYLSFIFNITMSNKSFSNASNYCPLYLSLDEVKRLKNKEEIEIKSNSNNFFVYKAKDTPQNLKHFKVFIPATSLFISSEGKMNFVHHVETYNDPTREGFECTYTKESNENLRLVIVSRYSKKLREIQNTFKLNPHLNLEYILKVKDALDAFELEPKATWNVVLKAIEERLTHYTPTFSQKSQLKQHIVVLENLYKEKYFK